MPTYSIEWDTERNEGVVPPEHNGLSFDKTIVSAKNISEFKEKMLTSIECVGNMCTRNEWELDSLGWGKVNLFNTTNGESYIGWITIEQEG